MNDNNNERWADLIGYEGKYIISSEGKIRNVKTQKNLKIHTTIGKYKTCIVSKEGKSETRSVAKLMLLSFGIDNPNDYKRFRFKDGNPENLTLNNLEWCKSNNYDNYDITKSVKDIIAIVIPFIEKAKELSFGDEKQFSLYMNNIKTLILRDCNYIILNKDYD